MGKARGLVVEEWLDCVDSLKVREFEVPEVENGEVEVEVFAVGANFFDILLVQGKYQFKPSFPFIPGAEFAGIVTKIGEGVNEFKVGDRVLGGGHSGAYAEKIVVSTVQLYKLPNNITLEQGAGFFGTYPTSYAALAIRAQLKKGETCLVHAAAGGVGIAAVQIAKALGATVIGTCGSQEKCEIIKKYGGADYVIDYSKEDWIEKVKEYTGGEGVDVVYDPVGLIVESTKVIKWNGRILVIGFAGGKIPSFPVNRALLKNCSIVGFMWGGYMTNEPHVVPIVFRELFKLLEEGKINPVVYQPIFEGLESTPKALNALASRKTYGKVVVRVAKDNKSKL